LHNCGYESAKWIGKCPACSEWNTFIEEIIDKGSEKENWNGYHSEKELQKQIALNEIVTKEERRITTNDTELNRVLGGGIVPGSIVLSCRRTWYWKKYIVSTNWFINETINCFIYLR
jgi:DNA repair protein RadA/Sms